MLALIILCIVVTWLVCGGVCLGVGGVLLRGSRYSFSGMEALWSGVAVITAVLQVYHFFRAIDIVAVYLLAGLGLVGWIWNWALLVQEWRDGKELRWAAVVLSVAAAAVIAFRCAAVGEHYDTGLYGAQAVRWFMSYRLVPGLGNLLNQFGFNSSVFLWFAALEQGPWRGLAHHLFDGFLIVALFATIIPAGLRVLRAETISASDWFLTLLFVPATIWGATSKIVGTNTDIPTSVVCVVAAGFLFRALGGESPQAGTSTSDCRYPGSSARGTPSLELVIAMVLFSLALAFKISSVVFATVGWGVAGWKLWPLSRNISGGKKCVVWAVILSAAIVLPWIGRGLVLTGYPFFPSTALSIAEDWKVPALETQLQADFARSFARVPELTYEYAHGWNWLRPWFRELVRERAGFLIPLLFAVAGGVAGIIRMRGENRSAVPQWFWVLVPSLGGLIFWFLEAPAMRFGEPVMWTAGATLGAFAALHFLNRPVRIRTALAGLLLLTVWAAHPRLVWSSYFRPSAGVRTFLRLPVAKLTSHETISGLRVNVPVETNQCWDAPLPCSPYFYKTLRLREPGKVERGFASEASGAVVKWK
jgi:hypothetical protein